MTTAKDTVQTGIMILNDSELFLLEYALARYIERLARLNDRNDKVIPDARLLLAKLQNTQTS